MLTREQIIEKATQVEKAATQVQAHLNANQRSLGKPVAVQELFMNVRRRVDVIAALMKELREDREARHPTVPAEAAVVTDEAGPAALTK